MLCCWRWRRPVTVVGLGLAIVVALRLGRERWLGVLARIASLGYAVPGTVLALGVLAPLAALDNLVADAARAWFGVATGLILIGSGAALVIAYTARFLSIAVTGVQSGYARVSNRIDDAARMLGAGAPELLRRIHWPMVRPAIAAARPAGLRRLPEGAARDAAVAAAQCRDAGDHRLRPCLARRVRGWRAGGVADRAGRALPGSWCWRGPAAAATELAVSAAASEITGRIAPSRHQIRPSSTRRRRRPKPVGAWEPARAVSTTAQGLMTRRASILGYCLAIAVLLLGLQSWSIAVARIEQNVVAAIAARTGLVVTRHERAEIALLPLPRISLSNVEFSHGGGALTGTALRLRAHRAAAAAAARALRFRQDRSGRAADRCRGECAVRRLCATGSPRRWRPWRPWTAMRASSSTAAPSSCAPMAPSRPFCATSTSWSARGIGTTRSSFRER